MSDFPAEIKPVATAERDYFNILKEEQELDWTLFNPAFEMHQGTSGIRKGVYRLGSNNPVFDAESRSVLSVEDLAMAITDELGKCRSISPMFYCCLLNSCQSKTADVLMQPLFQIF